MRSFVRRFNQLNGRANAAAITLYGFLALFAITLLAVAVVGFVDSGRQDVAIPLARAEEMATTIPDARLAVLEVCGHMAPLERPAEVSAALRRWLTQ